MPSRLATIRRRPLPSFSSLGAAIASGRGAAGGGGVVYGCAIASVPASASAIAAQREASLSRRRTGRSAFRRQSSPDGHGVCLASKHVPFAYRVLIFG